MGFKVRVMYGLGYVVIFRGRVMYCVYESPHKDKNRGACVHVCVEHMQRASVTCLFLNMDLKSRNISFAF